jgi:hypothetical protein
MEDCAYANYKSFGKLKLHWYYVGTFLSLWSSSPDERQWCPVGPGREN